MQLLIASHNLHKVREIREMLKQMKHLDIVSLVQFPDYEPEEEIGESFEEIASKKALHAAQKLGCFVLADDSGLCVHSLKNAPGIYSRRYAGPDATDLDNRTKLLQEMRHLPEEARSAELTCALALASPDKVIKVVSASCQGVIALEERGNNGFGYDPLFMLLDHNKTLGELPNTIKNRISHRYKALEKLQRFLLAEFPCTT